MDLHTVIILIPRTSERIIIEGVEVEIKKELLSNYLNIILEMATPTPEQFEELIYKIRESKVFLHFKDTHPNLIKCLYKSGAKDTHKLTLKFKGKVTDIEYLDYVTEVTNKFNESNIINWQKESYDLTSPNDPIDDGIIDPPPEADPGFKKKVRFRKKDNKKTLKRKLTF